MRTQILGSATASRRPNVKTYYWRAVPNFGDQLGPLLLKHFSDIEAEWGACSEAQVVTVGSVIEHIPPEWHGYILGAGKLFEGSRHHAHTWDPDKILALRGPLTAKGIRGDYVLGDPGLLADELVRIESKKYKLGIVPHWSDHNLALDCRFYFARDWVPKIIDPGGDPLDVIRTIGECEKIVSSSLHGIIVADAFGIPRRFEYTPRFDQEGGLFKVQDYSAAIGHKFVVGETTRPRRGPVEDVRDQLWDAFRELGHIIRRGMSRNK